LVGEVERRTMEGDEASTIRSLFADGEPRTAREVATGVGVDEGTAREALASLVERDELDRKTVGDDAGVTVWYPTPTSGIEPDNGTGRSPGETTTEFELRGGGPSTARVTGAGGPPRLEADLPGAVDELSVPGASEMMRSWRRDALLAAAECVADRGRVRSRAIHEAVYPGHSAGYDSSKEWWAFVAEYLAELPGIAREGDDWVYEG
jgi:hypothetical protein